MVTVKKKSTPRSLPQRTKELNGANGAGSSHAARPRASRSEASDCAFTEHADSPSQPPEAAYGQAHGSSGFISRGKDLLAGEAGGVATAAAIVVGAALIEVQLIPGLLIGAGAILLGKLFPEMSSYVRPVVKGAVRAGFSMSQKAREVLAEASEQVHDLVAEVKHEQEKEPPQSAQQARAASKIGAASGAVPVH